MQKHVFLLAALTLFGFLGLSSAATAGTEIIPPRITLTADQTVDVLTIINHRTVTVSYDLDAHEWNQKPDGRMFLPPTENIRVEPTHLEIPPKGRAQIRITAVSPAPVAGEAEQVYRISVQEGADRLLEKNETKVKVVSKFTLPVFQKPLHVAHHGRLSSTPLINGALNISVHNTGTGHTYVGNAVLTGQDETGAEIFRITRTGWYVLANGQLEFKVHIAAKDCHRSKIITASAQVLDSDETWQTTISLDKTQCGDKTMSEFPIAGFTNAPIQPTALQ